MKALTQLVLCFLLISCSTQVVYSQDSDRSKRIAKIIKAKKAYIQESISFAPGEFDKFWNIYDSYHNERYSDINQKRRRYSRKAELTDDEAEEWFNVYVQEKQDEMKRHIAYLKEMRILLGANRVLQLQKVERSFDRDVMRTLKTKKGKEKRKSKG